jgi:3-hydroxybutyryl-CoA dehydrogenase
MDIGRVAVIGGGTMGVGIARTIAGAGLEVTLIEKDESSATAAHAALNGSLEQEISRWGLTAPEKQATERRVAFTWKIVEAAHAGLIIETVTEDLDLKNNIFAQLDDLCEPAIIFVTNTSTLSITQLGSRTRRPQRFVGLHFVNPVPKTRVAEVIRGLATSDETVEQIKQFATALGKTAIEVFEYPGYVTTRVILPLINEAIYVVLEGVATAEDVDTAMRLGYDFPFGPLALADRMGLDEVMSWMDHLFHELGDTKYRPCPLLRKMVRAGRLGLKTGEGFFKY